MFAQRIFDTYRLVARQQFFDEMPHQLGAPAARQEWWLVALPFAEIQAVSNQVAHVRSRARETRGDIRAASDATERR